MLSRIGIAIALLALAGLLAWRGDNAGAGGLNIVVNTGFDGTTDICDETHCSLREAILLANANAGHDTIMFDPAVFPPNDDQQVIAWSSLPKIDGSAGITIDGTGASVTIVGFEVEEKEHIAALYVRSAPGVVLRDVTIRNINIDYFQTGIHVCSGEVPPIPPDEPVCGYNVENVFLQDISVLNTEFTALDESRDHR